MKKIFLAFLLIAASGVCGYARDVRVLLKDGVERKGELAVTSEDSVFIKFKNGVTRKFALADIESVIDEATGKDILGSLSAGDKAAEEKAPAAAIAPKAPEAEKTPPPVKAPEAEKAPEAAKAPEAEKAPPAKKPAAPRKPSDYFQPKSAGKAMPDNMMGWMSARYDAKTLLGMKWEHPDKARLNYAFEKNNYVPRAGFLAGGAERRGPAARLEIVPFGNFYDGDAWTNTTDSYLELRYAKAGAGAAWNIGYISYSETREFWDFDSAFTEVDKFCKTDAKVIYAALVLALPIPTFTYYGFVGPAIASYDYSETGTITPWLGAPTLIDSQKSGTAPTWLGGLGFSLRADSGLGVFGEFKHIAGSGDYPGGNTFGFGASFGF